MPKVKIMRKKDEAEREREREALLCIADTGNLFFSRNPNQRILI